MAVSWIINTGRPGNESKNRRLYLQRRRTGSVLRLRPGKNETCKKTSCGLLGRGFGGSGCTATTDRAASREGAKPYYIKVDKSGPEVSFVREYMEEAEK